MGVLLWAGIIMMGCRAAPTDAPDPAQTPPAKPARDDAPNVVLVSLDTMRSDRLTPYGYDRDTTPFLQQLADKGVVFTESYSQAPMTTPSHAAMFSGLYPFQNHTYKTSHRLPSEIQTLAETFRANGYATFARASSIRFHPSIAFDQGFDDYGAYWDMRKNDRSQQVISDFHAFAAQQSEAPVFAFVHLFDPHAPYNPPEPFVSTFAEVREDFPPIQSVDYVRSHRHQRAAYDPADLRYIKNLYDSGLRFTDHNVQALVEDLALPNGRSTLWVITSDHGDAFKEHGYLGHSKFLYEEIVRVPLLFVWEGHIEGGQRHAAPTQNVDLYPTIMALVGLEGPEGLAGRSLAGLMQGRPDDIAQPSETVRDPILVMANRRDWALIGTVQGRRFKLSVRGKTRKLFDLTVDPSGFQDVLKRHPRVAGTMMDYVDELGVRKRPTEVNNEREVSSEEIEMLRALGYVDDEEH